MTIDEVILAQRLSDLKRDKQDIELCIHGTKTHAEREIARHEKRLDSVNRQIAEVEPKLYWARLNELLHTPCWRYRVIA